ncbi:hypothetical protein IFM89_013974, partial [Coptis chinensis]
MVVFLNSKSGRRGEEQDLIDMRQLIKQGQDLYIRMAASELASKSNSRRERVIMIICIAFVFGMIVLSLGTRCLWKKRRPKGIILAAQTCPENTKKKPQ